MQFHRQNISNYWVQWGKNDKKHISWSTFCESVAGWIIRSMSALIGMLLQCAVFFFFSSFSVILAA